MSKDKETLPYSIQHQENHRRAAKLYPNGFGRSGMAAIGNGGVNYYHGSKHERPTKNTNDTK